MNNVCSSEDRSLLEVREWKELCRQETENLTPEEYLTWLRNVADELIAKYHMSLQVVHR